MYTLSYFIVTILSSSKFLRRKRKYAVFTAMKLEKSFYLSVGIEAYAIVAETILYSRQSHALSQSISRLKNRYATPDL